jgi:transposase
MGRPFFVTGEIVNKQTIFERACEIQAAHFIYPSPFRRKCNAAVYDAARDAENDVRSRKDSTLFRIVKSDTGTGKTTFCTSMIAAKREADPNYKAAYVVGTIKEAQTVFDMLAKALPEDCAYIHTSGHKSEEEAHKHGEQVIQHVQRVGVSSLSKLSEYPIIVCTHELWLREMRYDLDLGVRCYSGEPRRNVFVDEFPETIDIQQFTPADLDGLADEFERIEGGQCLERIVRDAASRFRDMCSTKAGRFSLAGFVSQLDLISLRHVDPSVLAEARDRIRAEGVLTALIAVGSGNAFLERSMAKSRDGVVGLKTLVTYEDKFKASAGLVVLDATADYQLRAQAESGVKVYPGTTVNYRKLEVTQIEPPIRFKNISGRTASKVDVAEYAIWITKTLQGNTKPGQRVLVVAPKKVAQILASKPFVRGREIDILHWGAGIGSNSYRDCETVFTFSEFHPPRSVYLARCLAANQSPVSADDVRAGNGSSLVGAAKEAMEAHRLRWIKQLAARGKIREVDDEGYAAPMRLFTTMDRGLLLKAMPKLFPHAPPPRGYDADWFRETLVDKGTTPCIPGRKSRKKTVKYDKRRYKRRNRIERMFGRLKDWRRVATRYDRSPTVFLSAIALAATVIFWL